MQRMLAVLCVFVLVVGPAAAQAPAAPKSSNGHWYSGLTHNFQWQEAAPIDLANSNRLESLLRAGKIYLSLQDAIALALENNLDIALQRYGPLQANASLLRAQAGGLLRGVSTTVQQATTSALSQATGGASGAGGSSALTSSAATGAGGAIVTATGSTIPNLDPALYFSGNWAHSTNPQSNSFSTGTSALIIRNDLYQFGVQQGFLTGTNVTLGYSNSALRTNAGRSDFNPSMTGSLSLNFTQHLLQGFGIAVNNRNIRVAKNNLRVSDLAFKQQVITTVSAIIGAYWDLVSFNENVKVQQQAVALNQ
jgi:outer membrane protein TolC